MNRPLKTKLLLTAASLTLLRALRRGSIGRIVVGQQAGFEFARYALQQKFLRGIRNSDRTLAKESRDAVVDVAANLHMTARLVRPNKQTEIERIVTELQKLHARLRLRQNIRHLLRCSNQSRCNQIYIGIVGDANRDRNTRTRIAIRPVHNPLANKL